MVIAYYLGYPLEEFVEGIIAAVRTVPGQEEVYVLAGILEFCGEVRALLGILKAGDIALFVTSGSYSTDAKHAASSGDKFIRLIDGDEFIEMWQEYYDKMSDEDKNMLPLKRISFLGNNE